MKKLLLFIVTITLTMTLTACGTSLTQHQKTLDKHDNYVQILSTTINVSGIPTTTKTYFYVDNETEAICITNYNPVNLLDQDAEGETPFGCLGMQVTIDDQSYYYDGSKAYPYPESSTVGLEEIFTSYFDIETYTEDGDTYHYETTLQVKNLSDDMLDLIGIIEAQVIIFGDIYVTVSMDYSKDDKMFTEMKVEYKDLMNALYDFNDVTLTASEAFTAVTYDYFDKKYSLDTPIEASSIDDYPDDLATAELVGYFIIDQDTPQSGVITDYDDTDIIQFDADGPFEYTFVLDVPDNQIMTYIVSDYNGNMVQTGTCDLVFGYTFDLQLIQAGTYYILLNSVDGATYPLEYTISVE